MDDEQGDGDDYDDEQGNGDDYDDEAMVRGDKNDRECAQKLKIEGWDF